jgi:hypothetical protein
VIHTLYYSSSIQQDNGVSEYRYVILDKDNTIHICKTGYFDCERRKFKVDSHVLEQALQTALDNDIKEIEIRSQSRTFIKDLEQRKDVRYSSRLLYLIDKFDKCDFKWIFKQSNLSRKMF